MASTVFSLRGPISRELTTPSRGSTIPSRGSTIPSSASPAETVAHGEMPPEIVRAILEKVEGQDPRALIRGVTFHATSVTLTKIKDIFEKVDFSQGEILVHIDSEIARKEKVVDIEEFLRILKKIFNEFIKNYAEDQNISFRIKVSQEGIIEIEKEIMPGIDGYYDDAIDDVNKMIELLKAKGVSVEDIYEDYESLESLRAYLDEKIASFSKLSFCIVIQRRIKYELEIDLDIDDLLLFSDRHLKEFGADYGIIYAKTPKDLKTELEDRFYVRFPKRVSKAKLYLLAEKNGFIVKEDKLKFEKEIRDVDKTNYVLKTSLDIYHLARNILFPEIKKCKSQEEKLDFFIFYKNFPKAYERIPLLKEIFEVCKNIEIAKLDLKRCEQKGKINKTEETMIYERLNKHLKEFNLLIQKIK
ncbi:MAG: hypothetical protein K1060chlam5_00046 [Candidatus Anoxychlamydiales bacterium]|nr:hypothetical protein [Candidatus Anoxychlamydiales bacterium]